MDIQQVIALLIVSLAALYLGRNGVRAWKALRSGRQGCESGCGKCGFAPRERADDGPSMRPAPPDLISLADIRPMPKKRHRG